jgi:benzoate-CoA ligase family protein
VVKQRLAGIEPMVAGLFPEHFNIASHFLDEPARRHPGRIAILGEPREVCYEELAQLASRVGNALLSDGCERGDRVLIALPDSAEFIAAFFGAAKIGAVAVPVNSMARAADYAHYFRDCGPRIAIVHSSAVAEFVRGLGESPQATLVLTGDENAYTGGLKCLYWNEWVGASSTRLTPIATTPFDSAALLYTSGSGGTPNGAVHQHKDMLVASRGFAQEVLGLGASDITFSVSKLFFAYGLGNAMYFPLSVGAQTLLNPERTNVRKVAELVSSRRPTVFFAVPTFYAALLREAGRNTEMDFSSVRLAVSAGETLPIEIYEKFRRRFGLEILDGIGSTEMLHIFCSGRPGAVRPGSCGIPTPGYVARIVDDEGRDVGHGEMGNLWVSGASAFACYWNKPELTARVKQREWVSTGDKFIRDADGYYFYCGRSGDMLKVSGMWVSPIEIENVLLAHPLVAEAAAVGITDVDGLTQTVAFVVLQHGLTGSAELAHEIREQARAQLVPYKCPREVRFCAELPKTATGKVQRFKLRDEV